jgi:outer membrane lipase/esterase
MSMSRTLSKPRPFFGHAAVRRGATMLLAALALAGCGGGSTQIEPFKPTRLFALGDEHSVIASGGRKYSINALSSSNAVDCAANPLWIQSVATVFELVFTECNPSAVANPAGRILAQVGAKAAGLTAQVDAQVAAGGFTDKDLVMVLVGANDVLEAYARFPAEPEAVLRAEMSARGAAIAQQVNRLIGLGAKVIVSTVPDLGLSPYALAEKAAYSDSDRAAVLTRLTAALNASLRTTILNDGRFVGLVLADEMTAAMVRAPLAFGLNDVTKVACNVALPDCSSATLVTGATASGWMWASDRIIGPTAQQRLGQLAQARAVNNPF